MSAVEALEVGTWRANADNTAWLLAALTAVVVPHMAHLPVWISVVFCMLVAWRWQIVSRGLWAPGRWLMVLLALLAIAGVLVEYRTLLGRDAGVALLTLLAGLKLLETRFARDGYVTLFLAFFLVVTNFLYSQSIATGVYMFVVTLMATSALVALQHPGAEIAPRRRLRIAATLLVQALPLMLVAFLLFPRLPGPLWGLPKDAHAGVTGLSDSMAPGQISSLGLSNTIAFRVRFDGPAPDPADMYWRGPVLDVTDGYRWQRARNRDRAAVPQFLTERLGRPVDYTVTLEPTQQRWLFALEMNATQPPRSQFLTSGEMRVNRPIRERRRYAVRSYLDFRFPASGTHELLAATALPPGFHPRSRQLADRWMAASATPEGVVERALEHFRTQPFVYTLEPPLAEGDPIDEFMFLTRRGFCEHYAAAFTVLMRAAGIPARVVTGYQGGERNDVGAYWIVRQRDAHAWSEVWLGERGWVRVDPTAAVAPERVERGVDVALPDSSVDAIFGLGRDDPLVALLRRARLGWDAVNDTWNQWVLGYGPDRQRRFLSDLGLDVRSWRDVGIAFVVSMALTLALAAAWVWRRRTPADPVGSAWTRFCARLAARGVTREPWEGPRDFALRAGALLPHARADIEAIADAYVSARYAGGDAASRSRLRTLVTRFRP